jgi:hypothetical protein
MTQVMQDDAIGVVEPSPRRGIKSAEVVYEVIPRGVVQAVMTLRSGTFSATVSVVAAVTARHGLR